MILSPCDFYLDLHQSLADQGFAKSLDRSTGLPMFFANPAVAGLHQDLGTALRDKSLNSGFIKKFG